MIATSKPEYKIYSKPLILGFCFKNFDNDSTKFIESITNVVKDELIKNAECYIFEIAILKYEEYPYSSAINEKLIDAQTNYNFDYLHHKKIFHNQNKSLSDLFNNTRKLFYRRKRFNNRRATIQLKPLLILFVDEVSFSEKDKNLKLILARRNSNKKRYKLNVFVKGRIESNSLLNSTKSLNLFSWNKKIDDQLTKILRKESKILER
jgi:hypothetical protein